MVAWSLYVPISCLSHIVCWLDSVFFFFQQKTADEMRISDWSSDVCSSDLAAWRRLRASGLSPAFDIKSLPQLGGLSLRRVAAALQIPQIGRAPCRERGCQYG